MAKRNRKGMAFLAVVLTAGMLLGCGNETKEVNDTTTKTDETASNITEMFTDRDMEVGYDEENDTIINLEGTTASCESESVTIADGTVTITDEGTYILSGNLSDGMIIIEAEDSDKIQLVLNGVSITSETSAAIYVKEADKVFITLAADTENELYNGGTFTDIDENAIDAVIFSKSDLTLNGSGSLLITSPAGHGIVGKDDLVVTGGNFEITAASHGLSANDSIRIADGNFTLTTGEDGINTDGFIQIEGGCYQIAATDDGFHADGKLVIEAGTINITSCYEGLEGLSIDINGGEISLTASDDGLNATAGSEQSGLEQAGGTNPFAVEEDAYIQITGGNITIDAAGDGIDSNGSFYVDGGTILVSGPTDSGNGALDYNGEAIITGGTVVCTGGLGMAQNFGNASTQGSILVSTGSIQAGSAITLTDSEGKELISMMANKGFDSVVVSCPELEEGATYTLTAGTYTADITLESLIYSEGGTMRTPGKQENAMGGRRF